MAGEDGGQERTADPTPKRIQEFRERGEVPKSQEVLQAAGLALGFAVLVAWAPVVGRGLVDVSQLAFAEAADMELGRAHFEQLLLGVVSELVFVTLPPLLLLWVLIFIVGLIQQRGAFPTEPFKLKPERFNPIKGFQERFMTTEPLVSLLKGLLKLFVIGWLVADAARDRIGLLPALATLPATAALRGLEEVAWLVLMRAIPVALIIAALDYGYNWMRLWERMKMTREEIKEEMKNLEGDPHIKAARRRRAQQIANAKTVQAVRKADVVITNPTHYAVALRYRKGETVAPLVVAKGADALAERIKAEARRLDIIQIENRPLARALYDRVPQGKEIPEDLYAAAAKVLAIVLSRRQRRSGGPAVEPPPAPAPAPVGMPPPPPEGEPAEAR
jgi:flagellar biosynthetic protein FlhB